MKLWITCKYLDQTRETCRPLKNRGCKTQRAEIRNLLHLTTGSVRGQEAATLKILHDFIYIYHPISVQVGNCFWQFLVNPASFHPQQLGEGIFDHGEFGILTAITCLAANQIFRDKKWPNMATKNKSSMKQSKFLAESKIRPEISGDYPLVFEGCIPLSTWVIP